MARVLIIGANRGIGLALARTHCARGDAVIAACRNASAELRETGAQVIENIDLRDDDSIAHMVAALGHEAVDRVLVVAGVLSRETLDELGTDAYARIAEQLSTNAIGPLRAVHALLPRLKSGARVGILTSRMGSMADNGSGGYYGYRMSKAAVNAAGRSLAMDLKPRGIIVQLLHPGYVQTDMTGGNGDITPEQSAAGLIARMDDARIEESGSFVHASGERLPW